jgi:hypothetical protein
LQPKKRIDPIISHQGENMKKTIAVIMIGLSILIGSAQAQEETKLKLADKLLIVMEMQKTIEQSFGAATQMMPNQANMPPEAQEVMNMIIKELSWENIKADYIELYAEVFTEDELKGLINFYESPIGKAYIKKQPELTQKSMMLSQKMMMKVMPKLPGMGR